MEEKNTEKILNKKILITLNFELYNKIKEFCKIKQQTVTGFIRSCIFEKFESVANVDNIEQEIKSEEDPNITTCSHNDKDKKYPNPISPNE